MTLKHTLLRARTLALALCAFVAFTSTAQRLALKSNALYLATGTLNLGIEARLSRHFTLNLEAAANPLKSGDTKLHLVGFMPEARYWFSGRPQARHFVGLMALGAGYDISNDGKNHKGDIFGFGPTYGYSFVLGRRWSLEATVGAGLVRYRDKKWNTGESQPARPNDKKTALAPLKLGLTFVYILK